MVIDAEETTGPALGRIQTPADGARSDPRGGLNHALPTRLDSYLYLTEEPSSLQLAQPRQEQ